MNSDEWRPYVSAAKRRANAAREIKKLQKKGMTIQPIEIRGRKIVHTFWGEAWCKHLERFSDFANRLPRGRTYVRNGSVRHLSIKKGEVEAIVSGSELYHVDILIAPLSSARWKTVRKQCAGQIGTLLELLQGQLSSQMMEIVTDPTKGLFPQPRDIKLHCDCPDWAVMCKHVAAVLYAVGARLDEKPEQLFVLREVDHEELISADLDIQKATTGRSKRRRLANQDLSSMFGIDIEDTTQSAEKQKTPSRKPARLARNGQSSRKKVAYGSGTSKAGDAKVTSGESAFIPTGATVARLRKKVKMTRSQFAELLGVSQQTVANWETKRGRLKLQKRTLKTLSQAWSRN